MEMVPMVIIARNVDRTFESRRFETRPREATIDSFRDLPLFNWVVEFIFK